MIPSRTLLNGRLNVPVQISTVKVTVPSSKVVYGSLKERRLCGKVTFWSSRMCQPGNWPDRGSYPGSDERHRRTLSTGHSGGRMILFRGSQFLLSSDIKSEGSIAIVKKFDFEFLWFLVLHHSHRLKMCFRKNVCVCLSVCLSVCLFVADRRA